MLPPLPPQPLPSHISQASFVSALAMEEESSGEVEKTAEPGLVTRQPHVMACYQSYLAHYQVKSSMVISSAKEALFLVELLCLSVCIHVCRHRLKQVLFSFMSVCLVHKLAAQVMTEHIYYCGLLSELVR